MWIEGCVSSFPLSRESTGPNDENMTTSFRLGITVDGIGRDKATFYREPATLTFFDTDGNREYTYPIELLIAEETTVNQNLDSVLGRDIFDHWNTIYYPSENLLIAVWTSPL